MSTVRRFTTRPATGETRDTEVTEKCSTEKEWYGARNSGDSVPGTHRRFAWCNNYLSIPKGCELTGYGRLPISGQSPIRLSSVSSVPLAKRVVNENRCRALPKPERE